MAGEWRATTVRKLVEDGILERPIDGNHGEIHPKTGDFVTSGIPFIMASDLVDGRVDTTNCAFITEEHAQTLRKGFAKSGDVLLSHKATMGRTAIIGDLDSPFLMLTPQVTYYRVLDSSRLSSRFLKFYFDSSGFQQLFEAWGHKGSTRAYLGITSQLDLPVVLPPLGDQYAIAQILGTLDDKIELNRRMSETLEAMARALFKSWFVDFDPVRAKAEGRDPGLPQPIADLFPDRFMESELGEIPEGWRVVPLGELTTCLNRGLSPKYVDNGGVLVLNQKCIRDGRIDVSKGRRHDPAHRAVDGRLLILGDILVNSTGVGTLGRIAQLLSLDEPTIVDSHITIVRADPEKVSWNYLGVDLLGREPEVEALGEGSTGQTELSRGRLGALPVLLPPQSQGGHFDEAVLSLRLRANHNKKQNGVLASLRDGLLPKLISGELRVRDAEKFVERAA